MVSTSIPLFNNCRKLKQFTAYGDSIIEIEIDARNKTGEMKGNYVDIDVPRAEATVLSASSMAYKCPENSLQTNKIPKYKSIFDKDVDLDSVEEKSELEGLIQ